MSETKKKVLIVEDDTELAELTSNYLERSGFSVKTVSNGLVVLDEVTQGNPDLVILDIMLPGVDGLTLCKQINSSFSTPILMLTARNDCVDQILGLEIGADDYVTKPVEPRLLLARVNALIRRTSSDTQLDSSPKSLQINRLLINDSARTATLDEKEIKLSGVEYDLLWLLASNSGEILSRETIYQNLRGISYDGFSRTIDVNISRIRLKLGDCKESPTIIKTIRNKGYMLSKG